MILDLCLRKTRAAKSRDYRNGIDLEKLYFQNIFCLREKKTRRFHEFLRFEERFQSKNSVFGKD